MFAKDMDLFSGQLGSHRLAAGLQRALKTREMNGLASSSFARCLHGLLPVLASACLGL